MGGSSVDGGKRQKRKAKYSPGGGRSKKLKGRNLKTHGSESETDGSGDGGEYVVEEILDKRKENTTWLYYIKWLGWPSDANTWEPKENLTGCEELLQRFEEEWTAKEFTTNDRRSSSEETVMLRKPGQSSTDKSQKLEKKKSDKSKREHSLTPVRTTPREKVEKVKVIDGGIGAGAGAKLDGDEDPNYEDLDVLDECPAGRVPKRLVGVVPIGDVLVYCVEWKNPNEETEEFNEPVSLIRGEAFSSSFPDMVIKFYEAHIIWARDPKDEKKHFEDSNVSRESGDKISSGTKPKSLASNNNMSDEDSDDEPLLKSSRKALKKKEDESDDDSDSHSKENYP